MHNVKILYPGSALIRIETIFSLWTNIHSSIHMQSMMVAVALNTYVYIRTYTDWNDEEEWKSANGG